jgi:nucleotide-binding universal stress UspA family protein
MDGTATVVVGVDGSVESRAALQYAVEDAARRGGRVRVVAVFPPVEYWANEWGVSAQRVSAEIEASLRDWTHEEVDALLRGRTALAAVPVEVQALPGRAGRVLVEQSRAADLLVVGHRGRGGLASTLLGSVGLRCVLTARCPVTVVRPVAEERVARGGSSPEGGGGAPLDDPLAPEPV